MGGVPDAGDGTAGRCRVLTGGPPPPGHTVAAAQLRVARPALRALRRALLPVVRDVVTLSSLFCLERLADVLLDCVVGRGLPL